MASNFNRKSNSSGSNASKPTFRKASESRRAQAPRPAGRPAAKPSSAARPASKPIGSYTATPKRKPAAARPQAQPQRRMSAPKSPAKAPARSLSPKPSPSKNRPAAVASRPASRPLSAPAQRRPASGAKGPAGPSAVIGSTMGASSARKRTAPRMTPGRSLTSVASPRVSGAKAQKAPGARGGSGVLAVVAAPVALVRGVLGRIPHPRIPGKMVAGAAAVLALVAVVALVVVNSALFTATNIIVNGSGHVSQGTAEQLIEVPAGTTLLNVDEAAIASSLESNPWVRGVTVERQFPDTLIITPTEWEVSAIAYITASDVAWAISGDNKWISPISLTVTVDAEGNIVSEGASTAGAAGDAETGATGDDAAGDAATGGDASAGTSGDAATGDGTTDATADGATDGASADGTSGDATANTTTTDGSTTTTNPDGTQTLTGIAAAQAIARRDGAVLFTDIASDVEPVSGQEVTSEVILAGLEYARGFSSEFIAQIKEISLTSVEAISADLDSGVEVSLGAPEDIALKERVVTRLLEQEQGVTYINVRTPDNYSFRSAPDS